MRFAKQAVFSIGLLLALALASSAPVFSSASAQRAKEMVQGPAASAAVSVAFAAPQWQIADPKARQEGYLGRQSLFLTSGFAFLKDVTFEDGVIEVDMATTGLTSFAGIIFRGASQDDYEIV